MANPILVVPGTNQSSIGFKSILGEQKSALYRTSTAEGGGIIDCPEKGTLEFYCAGFTKPDINSVNRQEYHRKIFLSAARSGRENESFPLPLEDYQIRIIHDHENKFDNAALKILLYPVSENLRKDFPYITPNGIDLGFVPARINTCLLINMDMINDIKILKTRKEFHEKYYTTKIVIAYGHNKLSQKFLSSGNRFLGILDEV